MNLNNYNDESTERKILATFVCGLILVGIIVLMATCGDANSPTQDKQYDSVSQNIPVIDDVKNKNNNIPDFTGKNLDEAAIELGNMNIATNITYQYNQEFDDGIILSQSTFDKGELKDGFIDIVVNVNEKQKAEENKIFVPFVVGCHLTDAIQAFSNENIRFDIQGVTTEEEMNQDTYTDYVFMVKIGETEITLKDMDEYESGIFIPKNEEVIIFYYIFPALEQIQEK